MEPEPALPIPSGLALATYAFAANLLLPPALLLAVPFLSLSEKRRRTLLPRLGFQRYPAFRPGLPPPIWVHALSVGELLSAVPFLQALKPQLGERPLLASVSTLAAYALAKSRLEGVSNGLIYFPWDTAIAYRRALARIQPAMFVLIETDLWPGYLRHFRREGVACWLLNGRLSPESFRGWARWRCLFAPALACFERIYGQSAAENDRFARLGAAPRQLGEPGNLKFDACGPPPTPDAVAALRVQLGYRDSDRILVAGSTHAGEEELIREAFLRLRGKFAGLKLIAVPRHPARGDEVGSLFRAAGLHARLLSEHEATRTAGETAADRAAPEVLVVDRLGYLNRLYSLGEVAVIGGSFVRKGGQNPIEPAAAGKPVVFGPDMSDFPEIARWLVARQAACQVEDAAGIEAALKRLLGNPAHGRAMGKNGEALVAEHRGVTFRIVAAVVQRLAGPA